jgi:hypothetical protein
MQGVTMLACFSQQKVYHLVLWNCQPYLYSEVAVV